MTEISCPGSLAMNRLREVFGPHIFLPDGSLDRLKVGEIVFNDEEKRQKLNGIIHPYIWYRTREELIRAQENGFPVTVRRTVIHILKKKLFRQKR